jgi:hypothetical protein
MGRDSGMYTNKKRQDQRGRGTQAPLRYVVAVQRPDGPTAQAIARARDREAAILYATEAADIFGWPAFVTDSATGEVIPIAQEAQEGGAQ